jgi:eukaryotic-like serine/threonine-protein kinase
VALKVLSPKRAREVERVLARFRREMELSQRVQHPNLAETFEVGEVGGAHYIAMEYVPGLSLYRLVAHEGPLTVGRAARVFAGVAAGLSAAHAAGIVHRDLKPSNIMVTPAGRAVVLDLGLALSLGEELPADKSIVGGAGYIVGTMDYIAPEQAEDPTRVTPQSDLYALGCSLFYALTGRPPFPGGTSVEKMQRHRTEAPPPLAELNPLVPAEFARLVESLMDKRIWRRPLTADAVRQSLLPWADPEGEAAAPEPSLGQAVAEAEAEHAASASVWERMPVVPPPGPVAEEAEGAEFGLPGWFTALLIAAALLLLTVLLEQLRRW